MIARMRLGSRVNQTLHCSNCIGIILSQFCSARSGLGIYISDDYNFKVMNIHEQSMLWDGMFVEISGQSLNDKKITLGNIYRPPRELLTIIIRFSVN